MIAEFAFFKSKNFEYFLNMEGCTLGSIINCFKNNYFNCSYIIIDQLFYTGLSNNRFFKYKVKNGKIDFKSVEYFCDEKMIEILNKSILIEYINACKFYLDEIDFLKMSHIELGEKNQKIDFKILKISN